MNASVNYFLSKAVFLNTVETPLLTEAQAHQNQNCC